MVQRWYTTPLQLVVWDWDRTVVSCHTFRERVEPSDVASRWKEDMADLNLFRRFVQVALERGIAVAIASYGRHDVISEYLKHIFADSSSPPFPSAMIVTPSAVGLHDGTPPEAPGKPKLMQVLLERAGVSERSAVLFFEDDEVNVDDSHDAGYDLTIYVPDGFSRHSLLAVESGELGFDADQAGDAFAAAWGHDPSDAKLVQPPPR